MKPLACLALLLVLPSLPALGALGGDAASIEADGTQMKGAIVMRQTAAYTVHEITAATGTVVREYVNSGGTVFAVAWQGPFAPNLNQLLGSYFEQYSAGVQQEKAGKVGRKPLNLQLTGLVVQRSGYMRAQYGRAYIPQQVPAGAKLEDLW